VRSQHPTLYQQQTGFSLLEMLIAFSLVSLLFVALFASFNTVGRSWESAEKRIKKIEDRQLISAWLQRQVEQMLVLRLKKPADNNSVYAFEGGKEHIRFTAPLQPLQKKGGIYFIELFITHQDKYHSLEMYYAPYRPDMTWEEAFADVEAVPIYQNFHQVTFAYLELDKQDEQAKWITEWQDPESYPLLLKISLEAPHLEPWPDIIIELPQVDDYLSTQHAPSKARHHIRTRRR
jgi:type II secretory pathway component PulJ